MTSRRARHPVLLLVYVLPVLLLVAAVVLGVVSRHRIAQPVPGTGGGPVALVPVDAPQAGSDSCRRLLAALPAQLSSNGGTLHRAPLRTPAPQGAAAWVGAPPGDTSAGDNSQPVVLRCGLPRPAELRPTSELIEINQVGWLVLSGSDSDSFIAVDRPVYIALTVPRGLGTGPVQTVADTVAKVLTTR